MECGGSRRRRVVRCAQFEMPMRLARSACFALRQFRFDKVLRGVKFGENAVIVTGVAREIERGATCRVEFEPTFPGAS